MTQVLLVDKNDQPIGTMEKMEAHRNRLLHRAISVIVFNSKGEMLLQKRAHQKYHSAGLWTNTCCSHPTPGEDETECATRRLYFEMGLQLPLKFIFKFNYEYHWPEQAEHEWDYVFVGQTSHPPTPNPDEVSEWKYMRIADVEESIREHPEQYTEWFKIIMRRDEWKIRE